MSVTLTLPSQTATHTESQVAPTLEWHSGDPSGFAEGPSGCERLLSGPPIPSGSAHNRRLAFYGSSSNGPFLTINYYLRLLTGMLAVAGGKGSCSLIQ